MTCGIHLDTKRGSVWLSYGYLSGKLIPESTLNSMEARLRTRRIKKDGYYYFDYDSIPAPSREKLPSKEVIREEYRASLNAPREQLFLFHLQDVCICFIFRVVSASFHFEQCQ